MDWQRRFNEASLLPKGMFVKTQSHCSVWYDKDGKHRVQERWLAFALNPSEAERLQKEPHLTGDIEGSNCWGHPDEHTLAIHP